MLKIGDTVRFLNAVGGGVVKGFQEKGIVLVEESDGFEIPVLASECVVINTIKELEVPSQPSIPISHQLIEQEESYIPESEDTPEGESIFASLAFIPKNILQLQSSDYDVFLINDSNYYLHYVVAFGKDDNSICCSDGILEPHTKYRFYTLEKDALNDWEHLRIQILAYKRNPYNIKPAFDVKLRINPVKFYKRHSFTENDFFDIDAWILDLIKNDISVNEDEPLDSLRIKEAMMNKDLEEPRRTPIKKNKRDISSILEVDLHITALLDTTVGMSNLDMLQYQLDKFEEVMSLHRKEKGCKIVFIHGKGEGVLRSEILKRLKRKYAACQVQDASFREYGFGATMVTIR